MFNKIPYIKDYPYWKFVHRNNKPLDGYLAETYFVDGSQLDQTYFGKFNNNGVLGGLVRCKINKFKLLKYIWRTSVPKSGHKCHLK